MEVFEILMLRLFLLISLCLQVQGGSCSWSNEDCRENSDCCSKSCHKAHEGTNPRCRHSTLGEPCVFDYHCQDSLECGNQYNCCSPFWKMCIEDSDCCEPEHVCRSADGFDYDRCLKPSRAHRSSLYLPHSFLTLMVFLSALVPILAGTSIADVFSTSKTACVFILMAFVYSCFMVGYSSSVGDSPLAYGAVG